MEKITFGTLDTTDPKEIAYMEKMLEEKWERLSKSDNDESLNNSQEVSQKAV